MFTWTPDMVAFMRDADSFGCLENERTYVTQAVAQVSLPAHWRRAIRA